MARNNECIEERKDSFRVKIGYYDELGIRRFYSKSFSIKKYGSKQRALEYAIKHRDEIRVKLSNKMIIKEKKASLIEIYNKAMELNEHSLNSKRKYDSIFNNHIAPVVDINQDLKTIKFSDIQKQLNSMTESCSQDYIKRAYSIWKMCYRYAISDDYITKDETYKVNIPKSTKLIIKKDWIVTIEDVESILEKMDNSIQNKRNRFLYKSALLVMLFTGMRPSEVFALEVNAIDLKNNLIKIYKRIGSTKTERHAIVKVKSEKSVRDIPIKQGYEKTIELFELKVILQDLIDNAIDGYLFKKDNGNFLNGDELSNICSRLSKGKFRAYMLRHQFTTDLLNQGYDLRTIMELMGHSERTMTLYYARSNEQRKREAIENRVINSVNYA